VDKAGDAEGVRAVARVAIDKALSLLLKRTKVSGLKRNLDFIAKESVNRKKEREKHE